MAAPARLRLLQAAALGALSQLLRGAFAADVHKQVVYTSWWPPGTEKEAESVGIISNGFVYMTGMMESNATFAALAEAELADVRDIARGAGADLEDLVDCLINAPPGGAAPTRRAFEQALTRHGVRRLPALTVVEAPGEYFFFNVSVACIARVPQAGQPAALAVRRELAYGIAAHGLLHLQAHGPVNASGPGAAASAALASVGPLVRDAGGSGLGDLAECTVFAEDPEAFPAVRSAFEAAVPSPDHMPALTLLEAGLEERRGVTMRCVAGAPTSEGRGSAVVRKPRAVVAQRMVYTSAQLGKLDNGTDAFVQLETDLREAGAGLEDVVNCFFYVRRQEKMFDFFAGFKQAFNIEHPPPPARDELSGRSECADCTVAVRCVAALPAEEAAASAEGPRELLV